MAFYLKYGSYTHQSDTTTLVVSKQTLRNEANQRYALRITWNITGRLYADTTAELVTLKQAMEAAYDTDGKDFLFYDSNGTIAHSLQSAGSITGTLIDVPPDFPIGTGAQLSTFLDYQIVAHCDYPTGLVANPLKSFTETLSFTGGGPRRAVVECANAPPQEQLLAMATTYRCTQSGSAVGLYGYPPIPPPIFPGMEEVGNGSPQYGSPRLVNGILSDWPVAWSYSFISATPLIGLPNVWPAG